MTDGSQRKLQMANSFLEVGSKIALWIEGVVGNLIEDVSLGNDIARESGTQSNAVFTTRARENQS